MQKKGLLATTLALLLLAGCSGGAQPQPEQAEAASPAASASEQEAAQPTAEEEMLIGCLLMNTSGEWFSEVRLGMEAAGKDLGVTVQIASAEDDASKEADRIDNFIGQKVSALAVGPINPDTSKPALERALEAGIPVVQWNTRVNSDKLNYFVGVNNYDLGAQTGKYLVEYVEKNLGGKAKIAVIGTHKYAIGLDRVNGFLEQVQQNPGIEVVANQDGEFKEEGLKVAENILQANPDVQIIWCWNQTSMEGALAGIKGANNKEVLIMGTDMSVAVAKTMLEENSQLKAVTTQQPYEIGYKAVESAYKIAKGEQVENEILVPLMTYTGDDTASIQTYIDERKDLLK